MNIYPTLYQLAYEPNWTTRNTPKTALIGVFSAAFSCERAVQRDTEIDQTVAHG